jgi:membrane protein implicated in regulation of membrane protease activity
MPYWLWLLCLIVEILAPHLVTVWFAIAALLTGVVAYWAGDIAVQLTVFSVISMILFSVGWFWLRKNMKMGARARHADETVIGESGTVVSAGVGDTPGGKVRFQVPIHGDDVWEFVSDEKLSQGDRCTVTEVMGTKVRVKKA